LWWLDECYNTIPDGVDQVIARRVNADHSDMLRNADGYMTAWFMYWLKDYPVAKPCGAEKPTYTAGRIRGLRGRADIQSSKCTCQENEN